MGWCVAAEEKEEERDSSCRMVACCLCPASNLAKRSSRPAAAAELDGALLNSEQGERAGGEGDGRKEVGSSLGCCRGSLT